MKLIAPKEYYVDGIERTGDCGSGKIQEIVIPDHIFGCNIKEACSIHDFMYEVGGTKWDKRVADRVFLWNMLRLIREYSSFFVMRMVRENTAYVYYEMVEEFGGFAFNFHK